MTQSGARRAIVTGAASGIGQAVAFRLLQEGIDVLAVDLDEERLAPVAAKGARPMSADVSSPADRERIAAEADGLDYLVNAAGIISLQPILEVTPREWRRISDVNAESVFFLCQAIGPRMREGAAIVNLSSSIAKFAANTDAAVYAASKAAVLSITRSFAYAFAPRRVRVNAICPGLIDTPMQDKLVTDVARQRGITTDELREARNSLVPLGRMGTAEETAEVIWFLLSDGAAYMTGQAINFTGGWVNW
jgi:NAD(P)-dependent dehydrogenase (short-subunit alcohol dehydrogenase family)